MVPYVVAVYLRKKEQREDGNINYNNRNILGKSERENSNSKTNGTTNCIQNYGKTNKNRGV